MGHDKSTVNDWLINNASEAKILPCKKYEICLNAGEAHCTYFDKPEEWYCEYIAKCSIFKQKGSKK
jgi:hypothetical protein